MVRVGDRTGPLIDCRGAVLHRGGRMPISATADHLPALLRSRSTGETGLWSGHISHPPPCIASEETKVRLDEEAGTHGATRARLEKTIAARDARIVELEARAGRTR